MPTTAERDALAAKMFPAEWARVANVTGATNARQKLRRRAEDAVKLRELRATGASCATCSSFQSASGMHLSIANYCAAESDFHGYVEAKAGGLCLHHRQR